MNFRYHLRSEQRILRLTDFYAAFVMDELDRFGPVRFGLICGTGPDVHWSKYCDRFVETRASGVQFCTVQVRPVPYLFSTLFMQQEMENM